MNNTFKPFSIYKQLSTYNSTVYLKNIQYTFIEANPVNNFGTLVFYRLKALCCYFFYCQGYLLPISKDNNNMFETGNCTWMKPLFCLSVNAVKIS